MFLAVSDLAQYNECFLPIETLRLSKWVHGMKEVCLTPLRQDLVSAKRRLAAAIHSINLQFERRSYVQGDFQLKNLISGVLLLPSLFLAARGSHLYKRESFAAARQYFPGSWRFIEAAEEIRINWTRPRDHWWKKQLSTVGHPRSRTLMSEVIPPRVNSANARIQQLLSKMEDAKSSFLPDLERA